MLFTVHYLGDYRERGMGQGDGRGRWERGMGQGDGRGRWERGMGEADGRGGWERGMGEGDYEKVMGEGDYKKRTAEGQNLIPIKLLIGLVMHFLIKIFSLGMKLTVSNLPWSSWYVVS